MFRAWLVIVALGAGLVGCAQFRDTVGCYSGAEFGLGYEHNFGSNDFGGSFSDDAHGNPKNHGGTSFGGNAFEKDRIETDVRVSFAPGACQ